MTWLLKMLALQTRTGIQFLFIIGNSNSFQFIASVLNIQPVRHCWLVWGERKILFWLEDTVHVNSARVRGLASTSQPASPAEQAD